MKDNNRLKGKILVSILMLSIILINIMPTLAEPAAIMPVPDVSSWAIGTLNEGERLGNYPLEWYYDGFRDIISEERLKHLVDGTAEKFSLLGLELNDEFVPAQALGNTRESVINLLYNSLAKYKLPDELSINQLNPIQYMLNRGIIKGTSEGLELGRLCKTEEAVIMATRLILDTYHALEKGSKGFMWKTSKNENIVYMLGSIHVGDSKMYPLSKKINEAYNHSHTLVVEANVQNQQAALGEFVKRAMFSDGTTLKDHISEQTYQKCLKVFEKFSLPAEAMGRFKPWSVANDLNVISMTKSNSVQDTAQATNSGIDMYFLSKAALDSKPVMELEGLVFQADLFNVLTENTQEQYLLQVLENILNPAEDGETSSAKALTLWQKQWQEGNLSDFKASYVASVNDNENELGKMLFGKRDEKMAEKIKGLLEAEGSKTYFVVVGAGHFTVKNSVIDLLIADGYEIEIIK